MAKLEWASCQLKFPGGQDAHSTGIDPAGRMPTLLLFILFPIP
ncbi:hypothetical protein [Moorena bouillonii]|nr:hypothetical protein [Moorena bouillonii]